MTEYNVGEPDSHTWPEEPMATTRTIEVKMAKASREEIEATTALAADLESLLEYGVLHDAPEDAKELHGDDLDRAIAERVRRYQKRWSLDRVVWGYSTLVENCCDPDLSYLEWRRDVREWLESQAATESRKESPDDDRPSLPAAPAVPDAIGPGPESPPVLPVAKRKSRP